MMTICSPWFWLSCVVVAILKTWSVEAQQVPAMFVFGDSMVDVGNNNFLNSDEKANYYPYGCDSTTGSAPSGRFSNGKNFVDMLGDMLGVLSPPAFADPSTVGERILRGVNYASAAAGILDETGQHYGDRYPMRQQVLNFETTLDQIKTTMGGRDITQYLSKSIAIVVLGTNDYINNYLMPSLYNSSYTHNPNEFANLLLTQFTPQVLALHSLGLRKFILVGIGPIGCAPTRRSTGHAPLGRCVDKDNQIVGDFNEGLRTIVNQLNNNYVGANFVYGNVYKIFGDMLNDPIGFGFNVIDRGCCKTGGGESETMCLVFSYPCANRGQYLYWDGFNPTEAANAIVAKRVFSGSSEDCYPINVQQMALI